MTLRQLEGLTDEELWNRWVKNQWPFEGAPADNRVSQQAEFGLLLHLTAARTEQRGYQAKTDQGAVRFIRCNLRAIIELDEAASIAYG